MLGGTAVDAAMIVTLGRIYGISITTSNARTLVSSILKAAGWVMLSEAVVSYASSVFKALTAGFGSVAHRTAPRCGGRLRLVYCRPGCTLLFPAWRQLGQRVAQAGDHSDPGEDG